MSVPTWHAWIARRLSLPIRLQQVGISSLLLLMVATRKHFLEAAARFSGCHTSQCSQFLKPHASVALSPWQELSKQQAQRCSKPLQDLPGLPWKIALLMDSPRQQRARVQPENAKKFKHGQGFVIGHQWTNIVLIIHDILIPLPPIPYYSKRYCLEHRLHYHTEHERVVDYSSTLHLEDYIGADDPRDVIVLADSGYDDKKIENAIMAQHWHFSISLRKTRRVKSERLSLMTPPSRAWCHMATFFRNHCRLKWTTIRVLTNGAKRKRMEFRIRHTIGMLRYVGKVQSVCSEAKKRPDGRRTYLACTDVNATARQIVVGYRLRWAVELFHTDVKMHLGFEDVATSRFDAVQAHVHWVYCAYILLHMSPPGVPPEVKSIGDKQRQLQTCLEHKEKRRILQKLTQIGGVQRYKDELRQALAGT